MKLKNNINQSLLTIAIPTYNRSKYLDLCLRRISEEISSLSEVQRSLVRIYVSDNASSDDTVKIITHYKEINAGEFDVDYNSENIGPDLNIAQCYDLATTPYVWIFGDDDVLLPGGLGLVLDVLSQGECDIVYANNYWFLNDFKVCPKKNDSHGHVTFRSSNDFARRINVMLTFLTGIIIRTEIGQQYRAGLSSSHLVQLSWVLPLLRDGSCFVIIEDWVVAARGSNSGGYELVEVFGDNLVKITDDILKDKLNLAKAIQNGTIVNFFPGFILEFRKGSSQFLDQSMIIGLEDAFGDNWRYHIFLAPMLRLPLSILNYYYVFLKVIRRLFYSILV